MFRNSRSIGCGGAALVYALAASSAGWAQSSPPAPPAEQADAIGDHGAIQDIVVTATRRETKLQSTPIAVSAVNAELIAQAAPRDIGDLAAFVPNFSTSRIASYSNTVSFAMRGVGSNTVVGTFDPPVVVLVDDFVNPSIHSQLLDPFDIAQVEVLRGPQGTLFGKNTTGGAIVVRTKKPSLTDAGIEASALVGSFATAEVKGAINVPLINGSLGLRLVGTYRRSHGFVRNGFAYGPVVTTLANYSGVSGQGDGRRIGKDDVFNGRAKLLWEPADNITAFLQYERLRDRSGTTGLTNTNEPGDPLYRWGVLGVTAPTGRDPLDSAGQSNRNDAYLDVDHPRLDVNGYYGNITLDTAIGTLTSVTGYREQKSRLPSTSGGEGDIIGKDGTPLTLFGTNRAEDRDTFQQELRFASNFAGPFSIIVGAFYQHEKMAYCQAMVQGYRDLSGLTTPYGPWNANPWNVCNGQRTTSKALFTEATYKFTPTLSLTGGFRFTWDRKRWRGRQQSFVQDIVGDPNATWRDYDLIELADFDRFPGTGVATAVSNSHSWQEPSYRVILGWQATDGLYSYASYSHGFKSGGYNQVGSGASFGTNLAAFQAAAEPTDPEKADSYEVGVKFDGLDRRLRFNLTGFFVRYNDLQKQVVVPVVANGATTPVTTYFNAAKADVKGIEAELTLIPIEELTLRGVLGYQDAKYKSFLAPIPAGYDLTLSPLDRAPKWQWTAMANYSTQIGDAGSISFNASLQYVGRNLHTQSTAGLQYNAFLDSQRLLNASVTYTTADGQYSVSVIGRNLTDQLYKTAAQKVFPLWEGVNYGSPRFIGVQFGVKL